MSQLRKRFLSITFIFILIISIGLVAVILNTGTISYAGNFSLPSSSPTATPSNTLAPIITPPPTQKPSSTAQPSSSVIPLPTDSPTATPTQTITPTGTPVPSPSPMPTPDPASIIFNDNFQSGNMSAWTSTDASGVNLGVKNNLLQCQSQTPTNGSWGYLYKWLDRNYTAIYWRWYVLFSNLPTVDGNRIGAGGIYNSAIENNFTAADSVCSLDIVRQNGVWNWQVSYSNATQFHRITSPEQVEANTWYLVELKAIQGSGTGEVHFYLNNVETLYATGLTNNNNAGIDHVSIGGGITANQPITWYCGGAVAAQTYVGPEPSSNPTTNSIVTPSAGAALSLLAVAFGVVTLPSMLYRRQKSAEEKTLHCCA